MRVVATVTHRCGWAEAPPASTELDSSAPSSRAHVALFHAALGHIRGMLVLLGRAAPPRLRGSRRQRRLFVRGKPAIPARDVQATTVTRVPGATLSAARGPKRKLPSARRPSPHCAFT